MAVELSRRGYIRGIGAATLGLPASARATAAGTGPPEAGGGATPLDPTDVETFFDERLPAQLAAYDLAGATVAVVADGEPVLTKGYGMADVHADAPVRADETRFRIASTSKAVTGTAVMRAVEAGHVDLDADVNRYLEDIEVPNTYPEPVTLEHLGTHTAGLASEYIGQYAPPDERPTPLSEVLADGPPDRVRPPGELAHYSNYGIALAGHAASRAAGASFADYVEAAVFEPLGMDRSTFRPPAQSDLGEGLTKAYDYDEEAEAFREIEVPYPLRRPSGSMTTTATDMARFMAMHLQQGRLNGRQFLAPETVAGMHDRRFSNHPAVNGTGYMFFEDRRGDTRIVKHGGRRRGVTSEMVLVPERGLGLFVAYNSTGADDAAEELVDAFVQEYAPPGDPPSPTPDGTPERADELGGWYRLTRVPESPAKLLFGIGGTVEVRLADDGTLVTAPTAPGVDPIRWVETEPLVFQAVGASPQVTPYDRLAFREEDGEITHLFFRNPTGSYRRLAPAENPTAHLGAFVVFVIAFLGAVFGWSGAALWCWFRGRPSAATRPRLLRWAGGLTGGLLLCGPAGVIAWLAGGTVGLSYGLPGWLPPVLGLSAIGALGAVGLLIGTMLAWRDGYWGVVGRVHYTALAITSLAFAGLLAYWRLLGLPL